ncbi:TrmH family RNA methyltransferase [Streptococcus sp. H31]|uniref:TrmH family RNA methyltransferase n=1 Tax=Streptococcus huangxiaojuni TaxID=3237239 RepID=UPI0034A30650
MTIITSKANNLIKKTKKLLQKKYRSHSYLIEGWHLFAEAEKTGAVFLNIFVVSEQAEKVRHLKQVKLVTEDVLKTLSESPAPQGIVAEVAMPPVPKLSEMTAGRFLLLEDIQDPGNLGTMVRTAAAADFSAVFVSEKSADIYNQKTLRAMQGSHFYLPVYRTNLLETSLLLQKLSVPVLATSLKQGAVDYRELPKTDHFALIMGNEGQGISDELAQRANRLVHIPMPGQTESLNVAVAAGIVIFSLI